MKRVLAILVALAALSATAMAFVPVIPDEIDTIPGGYVINDGEYSFAHVMTEDGFEASSQVVHSAMLFGDAMGTVDSEAEDPSTYLAGIIVNEIEQTQAEDVQSYTTRQYVEQGGSIYTQLSADHYDPQCQTIVPDVLQFEKSNFAWISGDMQSYAVEAQSLAAVGGNYLDEDVSECGNVWLIEKSSPTTELIHIDAAGDSRLYEAYAGTASMGQLLLYPELGVEDTASEVASSARMSGYYEAFGGFDNAWAANGDDVTVTIDETSDELFWNSGSGIDFQTPYCSNFGNTVTWP